MHAAWDQALHTFADALGASSAAGPDEDSLGGEQLDTFVDSELVAEGDRRDRIDARGTGLITTSAALATLMFAAAGLVTSQDKYAPPSGAIWFLSITFLAFAFAAFCGLMASRSEKVEAVTTQQLLAWRNDDAKIWLNTKDNVRWLLARAKILTLDSLRAGNTKRAKWAVRGGIGQLVALGGLLVAVGLILAHAIWPNVEGVLASWLRSGKSLTHSRPPSRPRPSAAGEPPEASPSPEVGEIALGGLSRKFDIGDQAGERAGLEWLQVHALAPEIVGVDVLAQAESGAETVDLGGRSPPRAGPAACASGYPGSAGSGHGRQGAVPARSFRSGPRGSRPVHADQSVRAWSVRPSEGRSARSH